MLQNMTKPQYKTQRQELEPPKSPVNTTTIPPLMTTLAAVVEVGVHITAEITYCSVTFLVLLAPRTSFCRHLDCLGIDLYVPACLCSSGLI